ncbi:hypothetical protein [Pedobacter terrae]|uniref:hypothetical protein n=1 Tax=Pedobacter terrae TaxID=405671 RepID=UPI002FFC1D3F
MFEKNAKNSSTNTVPVGIASQMTAAFRKSQDAEKGAFTEAAWFPADQIISLTKKLEEFEGDGIRIYFARYTDEIIDQINKLDYGDKIPHTYAEMNTLLLVITKIIDGKPRVDYFIDKDGSYGGSVPPPTDPYNRSSLCPHLCDDKSPLMYD